MSTLKQQIATRRTFAIISHPDAGKTTLTEKLLLYAGMIRTAGMVHGRKTQKHASSDWMKMEQERGISITASAMQFLYKGAVINVLDTPGHQDFSEDTYRTLMAADSAVMVIDSGKGVETQTKKLFQVCRMRGIPILTFVNKLDLPGREPLDLMAEVEEVLGIQSSALNWPIGTGETFQGVIDRRSNTIQLFEKGGKGGSERAEMVTFSLDESARAIKELGEERLAALNDELELLGEAGNPFSREAYISGSLTPVFFGSALTNFGVEPFFDAFVELAPSPRPYKAKTRDGNEVEIEPKSNAFSAFVFKVQANMDKKHRDSMAFLRICSGRFERDLVVQHDRMGKQIRLSRSHNMFGGERQTIESAYPGDIVGVVNPGAFVIGDSISEQGGIEFPPMPKFPPEVVGRLRPKDVMKRKAFEKGILQFRSEGAVLILESIGGSPEPLVAAVGPLQFEVLQFRLEEEYGVRTELEMLPYRHGSWLIGDPKEFQAPSSAMLARDGEGNIIMLYQRPWERDHALEKNPEHQLRDFLDIGGGTTTWSQ
ncbi:MAG: peptide chain release factor 3 [Bdellovibrionales bacterium]|nr:peptide chain release factor 3 [Bdellovibrionales bacterium]